MSDRCIRLLYLFLVFVMCMVSVYDNVLTFIHRDIMLEQEKNPVGLWIMEHIGVIGFVMVKASTTFLACAFGITILYWKKGKYRFTLLAPFLMQVALFLYLSYTPQYWFLNSDEMYQTDHPLCDVIEFYSDILK